MTDRYPNRHKNGQGDLLRRQRRESRSSRADLRLGREGAMRDYAYMHDNAIPPKASLLFLMLITCRSKYLPWASVPLTTPPRSPRPRASGRSYPVSPSRPHLRPPEHLRLTVCTSPYRYTDRRISDISACTLNLQIADDQEHVARLTLLPSKYRPSIFVTHAWAEIASLNLIVMTPSSSF